MEVTYYVACTLDGFIADIAGGLKWLEPYEGTDEDYGYAAFYATVDAVLLGRATYDFAAGQDVWPYADKPAWVFSHRPLSALPPRTAVAAGSPSTVVESLAAAGHRHAYLVGGGKLASSFQVAGLITRYVVSIVPAVLGTGLPMFAPAGDLARLELVSSSRFASGIVQLEYRPERDSAGTL